MSAAAATATGVESVRHVLAVAGIHGNQQGVEDATAVPLDGVNMCCRVPMPGNADMADELFFPGITSGPVRAFPEVEHRRERAHPIPLRPRVVEAFKEHVNLIHGVNVMELHTVQVGPVRIAPLPIAEHKAQGAADILYSGGDMKDVQHPFAEIGAELDALRAACRADVRLCGNKNPFAGRRVVIGRRRREPQTAEGLAEIFLAWSVNVGCVHVVDAKPVGLFDDGDGVYSIASPLD